MRAVWILGSAMVLAACESEVEPETAETQAEEDASEASESTLEGGEYDSVYTSLAECETLSDDRHAGGTRELKCEGPDGFGALVSESDLEVDVSIVPPEGDPVALSIGDFQNGGSNFLGRTIEWRGPEGEAPRALIMRHHVENGAMDPMGPETSWLLVAKIAEPICVVAKVPPGQSQNLVARRVADRDAMAECLEPEVADTEDSAT